MEFTIEKIENFLRAVAASFSVLLSQKQDLHEFAIKLYKNGTLYFAED